MFNGYHEPSATSYNDLELDRGRKNQGVSKWACGNGASIQSTHLQSQNQQSEIWVSKQPFIGLPNTTSPKCNCPSCYQLPESQSYQGEIPWHRSWFSRTYPVPTHDLVKLPGNHQWENAGESYPEQVAGQFVQDGGEKSLYYKPYSGLRHELYQPGVISTVKKVSRKQDLPKQDEVTPNVGHHARYTASVPNPGYESFRTAIDQCLINERTNYCSQNEKFINADSSRQQGGLGPYGLNPNRRSILESFSKTVPSNANQNRVPSVGHRNIKDNDFHSCIGQNDIEKINPYVSQGGTDEKHCKTDVNLGQENLHAGLMNAFSSTTDYHGINDNRELLCSADKDFQKFANGRPPQYFPRNNISEVIRNPNAMLNYDIDRKGVINIPSGSVKAAQTPPKHEIVSKSPNFGKDCIMREKMSPGQKLIMNNNAKIPSERFHKGNEIARSENILHGHITRPVMDTNLPDKGYNSVSPQNTLFKGYRRPPEYSYSRRNVQRTYDNPNGLINLRGDIPVDINQGVPNFPDLRKGLDAYPRLNNPFPHDGSQHQFEKLHYELSGDSKSQSSLFGSQFPPKTESLRETEKENPGRISYLEAIPYDEICKNGTSKISPLRLLRKKKLIHQKEDVPETSTPDTAAKAKNSSPPLDVRRFWATWAEEEEDNVPQTQMVVLDCHNIDPVQAGLLHLCNPESIRTVNLESGNVLDIKGAHFDKGSDQGAPINGNEPIYDEKLNSVPESERLEAITSNEVKIPVSATNIGKIQSAEDFSLGVPLIPDPVKEAAPDVEAKTNVIVQPNHFGRIVQNQPSDDVKQFDELKHEAKPNGSHNQKHSEVTNPVLAKIQSIPVVDEEINAMEERDGIDGAIRKEESVSSYSSDDSQTGDLPMLPDLPTSEYRKNKFLDYSDDGFCNGGLLPDFKETQCRKPTEASDCQVEDKIKDFFMSKPSEISPGNFEIDDILKKLSDINFQGVATGSPLLSDSPDKHKTDKKILESRKERKTKKQSHKSSRTDQVTLQNISLTKPTIKFSIQKSHDLKISFKVLNNKKKHEENSDMEDDAEDNQADCSPKCVEDGEVTDRLKKNKRRLITLKLKGVSEGNDDGKIWDEESARKSKKGLKKKKVRWERSLSPKTPVLKIKKSRYMTTYSCESEEVCNGATDDASKSSESEGTAHGDFQVHETVDSAKIKLTFKRNRIGGDRKDECCDSDEMVGVPVKAAISEDEPAYSTDSCLKSITDSTESPNDCEATTPNKYLNDEKEDPVEDSSNYSTVKRDEDSNNDIDDESGSQNRDLTADPETPLNLDEDMMDDFKKEDILIEAFDIVNSCDDSPELDELNSPPRDRLEMEQYEKSAEDVEEDLSELKKDSQSFEVDMLLDDGEKEEVEKNAEELQDEVFSGSSRVDDASENMEVSDDRPNEENCIADILNCVVREPLMEGILVESTGEEGVAKTEYVVEMSPVINADEADEKNDDTTEKQARHSGHQDATLQEYEEYSETTSVVTQHGKLEAATTTEQQGVDITEKSDGMDIQSEAEEPPLISDSLCDLNLGEVMTENIPGPELAEQYTPEMNYSLEQPKSEVKTEFVECDNRVHETGSLSVSETVNNQDGAEVELNKAETGVVDVEVEDHGRQEESWDIEQNSEPEQPLTKETVAEDNQTNEKKLERRDSPEHTVEDQNNNVRLYPRENVFVKRNILRRHSCEQETTKKRVSSRSTSLNIELTFTESGDAEIAVLDVDVSDIPLPSGEAPPENCLNFEEYFKSKQFQTEAKADVKGLTSPEVLEDVLKRVSTIVRDCGEVISGKSEPCDSVNGSIVREEIQPPHGESMTETAEKAGEDISAMESEGKEARELPSAEEIQVEDLEVFGTRDIALEGNSFRADQLYECEGLAFDEALTITDDMEGEKVSDDDKFRNIMQNCLENAKKFLSVGNLRLLSCSVDDLLHVDNDIDAKKSDSHVSKDVLLTSCEQRDDLILPSSRYQSLDFSDFTPSFCPDVGSNPCSEILPVDNWPYLEEEVASSPLRSKTEDSDVLCCLNDNSSTENFMNKFPAGKPKRQQRVSLHSVDFKRKITERRRTIEGIHRWKAFRSTDEELSDAENVLNNGKRESIDKSRQKSDKKIKDRIKPYSDSEGIAMPIRSSADYKSSSWQPRVVQFRISKNNPPVLPNKSSEIYDSKSVGSGVDQNHVPNRHSTLEKERQHQRADTKPTGMAADRLKRKKNRFRNLHTKKKADQTKENKSTAYNSNLVDSESDSEESSLSSDPPKEIVRSHNKSTKASNDFPTRKSKGDVSRIRKQEKIPERCKEKRKRDAHEVERQTKRKKPVEEVEKPTNLKYRRDSERRCWVCEVCGYNKSSERATHIQSHPFHCQSCHLAFKTETNFVEHLTRKHKDIRNQHHCLLCELSFDFEKDYYRHLETREHKHLESVEKNTINTLFRLLTGQPCPVLGQVESKPEWLPTQAGTVHFYHQATPLSLALQYLNLHRDKKKLSSEASE